MNKLSVLIAAFFMSLSLSAQNYASPESVIYDPSGNRYLVSNVGGGGFILAVDAASGTRSLFADNGINAPKGMGIYNGVVYVTDVTKIEGFSLENGARVFTKVIEGASFINDLAISSTGMLYAGDMNQGKVHRIRLSDNTHTEWLTGLAGINGLLIDEMRNRLISCYWADNATIRAADLTTAQVTTLLNTGHDDLDGLAVDNCGNYYVSSWGSQAVLKLNPALSAITETVVDGLSGPADIYFNPVLQELCIPNMSAHNLIRRVTWLPCVTPELLEPADESEGQISRNLDFAWKPVIAARSFSFQISKNINMQPLEHSFVVYEPELAIDLLDVNTTYFWRVAASSPFGTGDFSGIFSFLTEESSSVISEPYTFSWAVYPNPVEDYFFIRWRTSFERPIEFVLVNILGESVLRIDSPGSASRQVQIDRKSLPGGWYVVRALTDQGNQYHQRIILQ